MEVIDAKGYPDWTSLPREILALISSQLYAIDDVNNFYAVCKTWKSVLEFSMSKYPIGFGSQFLLSKATFEGSILNFYHPFGYSTSMDISELRGAHISLANNNGWLLVSKGYYEVFFFHPFSKSKIKLPNLPDGSKITIAFSSNSNPTESNCTVFGIRYSEDSCFDIYIISHGQKEWRVISVDNKNMESSNTNPIYLKGKFYYLFNQGEVFTYDPKEFKWKLMKPFGCPDQDYLQESYLLDFNDDLVLVYVSQMGRTISILRLDESNPIPKWKSVNDLGDYTFLLSETTSFATKCEIKCMRNKIYFPKLYGSYGIFFCMENKTYQTVTKGFDSKNFDDTDLQPCCSWIEPTKTGVVLDWYEDDTTFEEEEDDRDWYDTTSEEEEDDISDNTTSEEGEDDTSDDDL